MTIVDTLYDIVLVIPRDVTLRLVSQSNLGRAQSLIKLATLSPQKVAAATKN